MYRKGTGGGVPGVMLELPKGVVAAPQMGSRRDEVRFLAIAEKTAMRVLSCKQKILCVPTQLTLSKEVAFLCTSILCP